MPASWQEMIAVLVRHTPFRQLMVLAVRLLVPRHRIGVGVVALNQAGQVLLLRHVFHPATPWGLPGGWLGRHEDPAAGAARELREETGLECRIGALLRLHYEAAPAHVGVAFLAFVEPGHMTLSHEILEAGWFAPDALPGPMMASVTGAIAAALALRPGVAPNPVAADGRQLPGTAGESSS